MSLEEFKQLCNSTSQTNNYGFGGITREKFFAFGFKIIQKNYSYTDKSSQSFIHYYFENEEVTEADFLTLLLNFKL